MSGRDGMPRRREHVWDRRNPSAPRSACTLRDASPATFSQAVRAPTSNLDLIRRLLSLNEALGGPDNGTALVLPTRFEPPNGDSDQGLNLTFWSPSDRLGIWIPAL
jgi:hypothetical protein